MTLSGQEIQRTAQEVADGLPGTNSGYPFTQHLWVWKVMGKVFLIVTEDDPDLEIITVKADPERGAALRRDYEAIRRGQYLDKQHWITVGSGAGMTKTFVRELVEDSFDLVKEQLPVQDRPE